MKKLLALLLVLVMILSLAACGSSGNTAESTEDEETTTEKSTEESTVESGEETTEESAEETQEIVSSDFEEIVILDTDEYTFKITSIDEDDIWGYTLKVFMENKTSEKVCFSWDSVSVNGFVCDPLFAASVPANGKANQEVTFFEEAFLVNGIETVTDIEFTLSIFSEETWDTLCSSTETIYPLGEDAVVPYVREAVEGETVLIDNEYATVILTGVDPEGDWGYTLNVYVENKTDSTLVVSTEDVLVNGFVCDPFWAEFIPAGKRVNSQMSWFETDFEDNGITEVETITMSINAYDDETWEDYFSESVTIEP